MWTKEEFNILKENYSSILCIEDLMAMLPGRTYNSIIKHILIANGEIRQFIKDNTVLSR